MEKIKKTKSIDPMKRGLDKKMFSGKEKIMDGRVKKKTPKEVT